MLRSRFAPTPSGFLHLGNAVHLSILAELSAAKKWQIALRIDDLDTARTRPEYIEDVFSLVQWLNVPISIGPRDDRELRETWSQHHRSDQYAAARDALINSGASVYVCACSRREWEQFTGSGCPNNCKDIPLKTGESSLRMHRAGAPDVVVWRRDGFAAYHLASVVDDTWLEVTHIVRGQDLNESTQIQREISRWIPGNTFADVEVIHHPLVVDAAGCKLSKSAGSGAQPLARTEQMRARITEITQSLLPEALPDRAGESHRGVHQ